MLIIGLAVLVPYLFLFVYDAYRRRQRTLSAHERRLRRSLPALHAATFAFLCLLPAGVLWWPIYALLVLATITVRLFADADRQALVDSTERFRNGLLQTLQAPLWILVATLWEFIDGAGFIMKLMLPLSMRGLRPLCEGTAVVWAFVFLAQIALSQRPVRPAATLETVETELPKAS